MKFIKVLIILVILAVGVFSYYQFVAKKQAVNTQNPLPSATPTSTPASTPKPTQTTQPTVSPTAMPTPTTQKTTSPTPYPDTQSAIQAFLAKKYNKPISEVKITVAKEVPGFAAGSVLFGQGGPGEGGMWLAVLGNGWEVVWDGNGNVDCDKMRQTYGFPDAILKPNFCN